jgi:hypothetical protein
VRNCTNILAVIVAALFLTVAACRSVPPGVEPFHAWGWENAQDGKAHLDAFKHILLICVYEDRMGDHGPGNYSAYRAKGTVVRSYKGDWNLSERISFVHWIDSRLPPQTNINEGKLMFVFTDRHADAEIALEAGEFRKYEPDLERVLLTALSSRKSR